MPAVPALLPQLVAGNAAQPLRRAIAAPERYAVEPKVDGVRALIVWQPDGTLEARDKSGQRRDWFRNRPFADGLRRLADLLPILWQGTTLDGELTAGAFRGTEAAIFGSKRFAPDLRLVAFDVPFLAGVDLRNEPCEARRQRPELLALDYPLGPSPLVEPSNALTDAMLDDRLEGIVLKDRTSRYRCGSRVGWAKVKEPWLVRAGSLALRPPMIGGREAWTSRSCS